MLKKETIEKDVYVYKCDICGKEFEFAGENHPNTIHYDCDGFDIGYYEDAEKIIHYLIWIFAKTVYKML